jgi:hypothetical protein
MSSTHFSVEVGRPSLQRPCIYLPFPSRRGWKVVMIFFFFFFLQIMLTRMTLQSGLIRMLMWHHKGMIRGTWHVLAACWRELDTCWHIQARGEHMKTREKEGSHSAGAWKGLKRKVVTPPARGKKGLLSDGTWKSVTALMMKISPGIDRSGDVLHRSGVCFPSRKRLHMDRKVVTQPAHGSE